SIAVILDSMLAICFFCPKGKARNRVKEDGERRRGGAEAEQRREERLGEGGKRREEGVALSQQLQKVLKMSKFFCPDTRDLKPTHFFCWLRGRCVCQRAHGEGPVTA